MATGSPEWFSLVITEFRYCNTAFFLGISLISLSYCCHNYL